MKKETWKWIIGLAVASGFVTLMSWLIVSTVLNNEFRERGPRFTPLDAAELKAVLKDYMDGEFKKLNASIISIGADNLSWRVNQIEVSLIELHKQMEAVKQITAQIRNGQTSKPELN